MINVVVARSCKKRGARKQDANGSMVYAGRFADGQKKKWH